MQIDTAKPKREVALPRSVPQSVARTSKRQPRVPERDVVNLTSQLAIMIRSGVDIASALSSASRQCRRPVLGEVLNEVRDAVLGGQAFSEALKRYPKIFSPAYVATVAAGEASGHMADVLDQLAELERSHLRLMRTIRGLLVYPVLLATVSMGVIGVLLVFVLPRFSQLFTDYEMSLPWLTEMLIVVADQLRLRWWLWLPLAVAGVAGLVAIPSTAAGRRFRDRMFLTLPMLGDVTKTLLIGRSCRLIGMLMESGVPLLDSVQLARESSNNSLYKEVFLQVEDAVVNGRTFAGALAASAYIPDAATEMLTTAEQSGKLGEVSRMVGSYFEDEGEARARQIVTALEPMITVGMGIIVATVVLAVMLPVFDLSSFAGKG
ncbi:type II secretion system F family protein [Aeoliella sp.]|uniref:type II secretion system F family protein n=1 Tax=Aeoliella sp. TaxID=2795800 RepID=UPI003CCB7B49